jgi:putative tributyrin esterase
LRRTGTKALPLLLLLLLAPAAARAQATAPRSAAFETVRFESRLVGKPLPYNVVLPRDYADAASRQTRYPVLYLLHGFAGHYDNWVSLTNLTGYASQHRLIVVTPEGNNGWYTDSAAVPSDKYESYVVRELMADVEKRFRTIEAREGRAVAGLSMGGYGALKFGVKYPEKFALAASMSGAVMAASWRTAADLPFSASLRQSFVQTFGDGDHPTKSANDLFKLVREMPAERLAALPFLYLDCGTEDPLELLAPNRAFADLLVERKVAHEYRQLPGRHDWAYWDRQVQEVLRLATRTLAPPRADAPRND